MPSELRFAAVDRPTPSLDRYLAAMHRLGNLADAREAIAVAHLRLVAFGPVEACDFSRNAFEEYGFVEAVLRSEGLAQAAPAVVEGLGDKRFPDDGWMPDIKRDFEILRRHEFGGALAAGLERGGP